MTGESLPVVLRAELDRLEAIAREATEGPWTYAAGVIEAPEKAREVRLVGGRTSVDRWYVVCDSSTGQAVGDEDGRFIAANDPGVVLRTIQAHRKILDDHVVDPYRPNPRADECAVCTFMSWPCPTVVALASIYFPESDAT